MQQLSLVALYGTKNTRLEAIIRECQEQILAVPNIKFQPYEIAQIHATLISLEHLDRTKCNWNFFHYQNQKKIMDFHGLLEFLRRGSYIPFQVQVGGFENRAYLFTSRKQSPFDRSFQISQDKIILIGWPTDELPSGRTYPNILDKFRRQLQSFNILHTYHQSKFDIDNDFYFRLGLVNPASLTAESRTTLENKVRTYLATCIPTILDITASNVYVVSYNNSELPVNQTKAWPISDPNVTPDFLWNLVSG